MIDLVMIVLFLAGVSLVAITAPADWWPHRSPKLRFALCLAGMTAICIALSWVAFPTLGKTSIIAGGIMLLLGGVYLLAVLAKIKEESEVSNEP